MVRAPSNASKSPLADLDSLPSLFSSAQTSSSAHRRSLAALHKIFLSCSAYTTTTEDGSSTRLTGEKEFLVRFKDCVDRLLDIKKGITQADRVVKFVAAFVTLVSEEAAKKDEQEEDGPAARFSSSLLRHLLKGFISKNKTVRYRCAQLVAQMINGLGEMDEDLYDILRNCLMERIKDKEAPVRVQAVIALSKLQNAGTVEEDFDPDADSEEEDSPTKALIRIMTHDPSAEVRRAALFQLDLETALIPSILSRTRDVDVNNRRLAFQASLIDLPHTSLTEEQKLQIIKSGLKDREQAVQRSASKLVAKWAGDDLLGLLESFGILDASVEENKTLEEGLFAILDGRRDLLEDLNFDDAFWTSMTPATSFLARVAISFLREQNNEVRLEELLPVATALAFRIEHVWNNLRDDLTTNLEPDEQSTKEQVFVLKQLLGMALFLDFSDEAGRRKMFAFMREMISHPSLPLSLVPAAFDIFSKLATNERDFLRVTVEIVQELREDANVAGITKAAGEGEDSDDEDAAAEIEAALRGEGELRENDRNVKFAQQEEMEEDKTDVHLRCLCIVQALLERVVGTLQDNSTLSGLVHEVIVPSVRSKVAEVRELGIVCLGLCCLLDKNMAIESFGLFVNQAVNTEAELQEKVYQIIFDLFTIYGIEFLAEKGHGPDRVLEFIAHALEQEPGVQAIATIGIAKLTLSGVVSDTTILQKLVIVYFAPETAANQDLRQCLTYFFPVYCYSSSINQRKMLDILLPTFGILKDEYNDADDNTDMIPPAQIVLQLIDWTDPTKAVTSETTAVDTLIHVDLTMSLLKQIYTETAKDERKRFAQLLSKLHLPPDLDEWRIRALLYLITSIQEQRPLGDAVSRNALIKLETIIKKTYGERATALGDEDHEELNRINESEEARLYAQVQDFVREEQEREDEVPAPKAKKAPPKKKGSAPKKGRARSQSAAVASNADSDEDAPEEEEEAPRRSTRATRSSSRVSTTTAKKQADQAKVQKELDKVLQEEGAEEEEDGLEDVEEEESEASDSDI